MFIYIVIVLIIIRGEVEHEIAKAERVETLLPAAYKYIQRYQKEPRTVILLTERLCRLVVIRRAGAN